MEGVWHSFQGQPSLEGQGSLPGGSDLQELPWSLIDVCQVRKGAGRGPLCTSLLPQ